MGHSKYSSMPREPNALKSWCKARCDKHLSCHAVSTFSMCKPGSSSCNDSYCFLSKNKPVSVKKAAPMRCAWKQESIQEDSHSRLDTGRSTLLIRTRECSIMIELRCIW